MTKPHEETWSVVGCSNPAHGAEWTCWKVQNGSGAVVLRGVNKATAQRYAAFPAMARALLGLKCADGACTAPHCRAATAALKEAGVLE